MTLRAFLGWSFSIAAVVGVLAPPANAQAYPSQPVHIVVPFPPGGGLDTVVRTIQPRLSEFLGQQVIVDNRPGAAGMIGASHIAKAAPDGYNLLAIFDTHAVNEYLYQAAPKVASFDYVSLMVSTPQLLVAGSNFTPNSLPELIAAAKAKPGHTTYGSLGSGSSNHLGMLLLSQRVGIQMLHVPFKGGAPLVQSLLGNQVEVTFTFPAGVLAHVKSGKLKAIAVGGTQRMPQLPDVPTVAEFLPGFKLTSWFGMAAPKGMPPEILDRIQRDIRRALTVPEVRERLERSGYTVDASSSQEFVAFIHAESDKLGKVIRDNGVKVE